MKKFCILITLLLGCNLGLFAQCEIDGPTSIVTGCTEFEFSVKTLDNSDLGVNQELALVNLGFRHKVVGKLEVSLISPSGDEIVLVGQAQPGESAGTEGAVWEVRFLASDNQAVDPDNGADGEFPEIWDNNNPWVINTRYTGSYYPNQGSFEDFTGSALGTWTLKINDLSEFGDGVLDFAQLQFEDQSGFDCCGCFVEAGFFNDLERSNFCTGDPDLSNDNSFSIEGRVHALNSFDANYVIIQAGNIFEIQDELDMSDFDPGSYTICGLLNEKDQTVEISAFTDLALLTTALASDQFCGDLMEGGDCLEIQIQAPRVQDPLITEIICPDPGFTTIIGPNGILNFSEPSDTTIYRYDNNGVCDICTPFIITESSVRAIIETPDGTSIDCGGAGILLSAANSINAQSYQWTTNSGSINNPTSPVVTVSEPGTYTLTVNDGNCDATSSVTIELGGSYNYTVDFDTEPIGCLVPEAGIEAIIDGTFTSVEWVHNGSTSETISVTEPGFYTLIVFDDTNSACPESRHEVEVIGSTTAQQPIFNNFSTLNCATGTNVSVINEINAATAEWFDSEGGRVGSGMSVNLNAPGDYTFTYTDIFGCTASESFTVEADGNSLDIDLSATNLGCNDFEAQISTNLNGGTAERVRWSGPNQYNSSALNPLVELQGTYNVTVTDESGCTATEEIRVEYGAATAPLNNLSINGPSLTCEDAEATILISGAMANSFEYAWEQENGGIIPGETSRELTVQEPGDYFVFITDPSNGCTIRLFSFVDFNNRAPNISFENFVLDCDSPTITLLSDADISEFRDGEFAWTGPNGFNSTELAPTIGEPGEYTISGVRDLNGCEFEIIVDVTQDITPIEMRSVTGETSTVFDCNEVDPQFILETDRPGDYVVTTPSGFVRDTVRNTRTLPLFADSIGVWSIEVIATNGCFDNLELEIIEGLPRPSLDIAASSNFIDCMTTSVTIDGISDQTMNIDSWTWVDGVDGPSRDITDPGQYTLEIINDIGCNAIASITIEDNTREVEAILSQQNIDCNFTEGIAKVTSLEDNLIYEWTDEAGMALGTPDVDSILVSTPGMYTVLVTADDGCTFTETIEIVENIEVVEFEVSAVDVITCNDPEQRASLDDTQTNFNLIEEVFWIVNGDTVATGIDTLLEKGGNYTVVVLGANGCESMRNITVDDIRDLPIINLIGNEELNCISGDLNITVDVTPVLGEAGSNWDLSDNQDGIEVDGNNVTITEPGEYIFEFEDTNGCSLKDTVSVLDAPTFDLVSNDIDCANEDATIDIMFDSQIDTISWTLDGVELDLGEDSLRYITTEEGIYEIFFRGNNGCTNLISDTVFIFEPVTDANLIGNDPCPGEDSGSINISDIVGGAGDIQFSINDEDFIDTSFFQMLEADTYIVTLRDSINCTYTDTIVLNDGRPIDITLGEDFVIDIGRDTFFIPEITIDGSSFDTSELDSIFWTSTDGHFNSGINFDSIMPFVETTFTLTLQDSLGCTYSEDITVDVSLDNVPFYFGNIANPNPDDPNSLFGIRTTSIVEQVNSFMILDRWGNTVFQTGPFDPALEEPQFRWDGMSDGKRVSPGVYIYMLEIDLRDNGTNNSNSDIIHWPGNVTIVK